MLSRQNLAMLYHPSHRGLLFENASASSASIGSISTDLQTLSKIHTPPKWQTSLASNTVSSVLQHCVTLKEQEITGTTTLSFNIVQFLLSLNYQGYRLNARVLCSKRQAACKLKSKSQSPLSSQLILLSSNDHQFYFFFLCYHSSTYSSS